MSLHVRSDSLTFDRSLPSRGTASLPQWQCPHSGALLWLLEDAVECATSGRCGLGADTSGRLADLAALTVTPHIIELHV